MHESSCPRRGTADGTAENNHGASYHIFNSSVVSKILITVGTKILADPEKCFQELISEKLLILLRERPRLELIIVSSNFFHSLLFLQD